eukprot:1412796-Pyramimonas_sp.AAC.1
MPIASAHRPRNATKLHKTTSDEAMHSRPDAYASVRVSPTSHLSQLLLLLQAGDVALGQAGRIVRLRRPEPLAPRAPLEPVCPLRSGIVRGPRPPGGQMAPA